MREENVFVSEWQKTLSELTNRNASIKSYDYFLKLASEYSDYNIVKGKPKVVLLEHFFPEEIIRAMGIDFCYVLNGDYDNTTNKDVSIPKDADDTTQSILRILKSDKLNLTKDDVILVPLCSDSMVKLKTLVEDITNVICYEVPFDKKDELQINRFVYEIERVTQELKQRFKKKLSLKQLKRQCIISKKVAEGFIKLETLWQERNTLLSIPSFMFIANSYAMCKSREEWISHLELLIKEIDEKSNVKIEEVSNIILFGSPIYMPNYKVLFAIDKAKLKVRTVIHPIIEHIKMANYIVTASVSVKYLARKYLEYSISPNFINNSSIESIMVNEISFGKAKGIIAHILKGQIEYDYEYKTIEQLAEKYKIPLNKIETLYSYNDIEQVVLRLEAFYEMLK